MPADTPSSSQISGAPSLPDDLAGFAQACLGPIRTTRFCGWDHAESRVWELVTATGETAFLKAHRQSRKFRQELRAYEEWLPQLPAVAPGLLAVHRTPPFALLLSAAPGVLAEAVSLERGEERALYRRAGAFLRALHDLPLHDDDPLSPTEALQMRLDAWLPRARGLVTGAEMDWVASRVRELIPLLEGLARVPCHRDYTPRNWLVDRTSGEATFRVIDFEHARPELRVLDFERMWLESWPGRPDLQEAFCEGYGRSLTGEEAAILERHAALWTLSTIAWAHEHGDEPFERQARQILARLRREK